MIRLYSWNVNGIRALSGKGLWTKFLNEQKPDILCLQEIKAKPEQIDVDINGYDAFWYSAKKPGYSGTAILSRIPPIQVIDGFSKDIIKKYKMDNDKYGDPNEEGRVISAEFAKFWVISVYTPNAKEDLSRITLKLKHWDPAFLAHVLELEKTKPVIFCGDINVAYTEDDLANPKANKGKKGFTTEERHGFQALIDNGYVDTFRLFHKGNSFYTWWSYFANARARNVGWRIDYIMVSNKLKKTIIQADIHPDILGSDHCPVSATINL